MITACPAAFALPPPRTERTSARASLVVPGIVAPIGASRPALRPAEIQARNKAPLLFQLACTRPPSPRRSVWLSRTPALDHQRGAAAQTTAQADHPKRKAQSKTASQRVVACPAAHNQVKQPMMGMAARVQASERERQRRASLRCSAAGPARHGARQSAPEPLSSFVGRITGAPNRYVTRLLRHGAGIEDGQSQNSMGRVLGPSCPAGYKSTARSAPGPVPAVILAYPFHR